MKVECCDNCKRPFERFEMDNGGTAWGFILDNDGETTYLMSDLTHAFFCFTDKEPERREDLQYWCANCVEAVNETDEFLKGNQ